MGFLSQLFSLDQLKSLDARDIQILRDAIQRELRTSPAVRDAIRANVEAVFNQLRASKAEGGGQSRPPGQQAP